MTSSPDDPSATDLEEEPPSVDIGFDTHDSLLRAFVGVADRPLPLPDRDRTGTRLGKYLVCEKLGSGGMGVVYRADDVELGGSVALKVLRDQLDESGEHRRRFLREARAGSRVRHPNVVGVLEVGDDAGDTFIAMELVRGESLRDRIARGALPIDEVVRIGCGVASALEAAHASGLAHRDLKPDNVMIDGVGQVKVLDFGLARFLPVDGSNEMLSILTSEGNVLGTPGYMSPEQLRGSAVGRPSDIFSFGILLFELLTGERPFAGPSKADVILATIAEPAPIVLDRRPDTPPLVARLLFSMLEKDPANRPAIEAVVRELSLSASALLLGPR